MQIDASNAFSDGISTERKWSKREREIHINNFNTSRLNPGRREKIKLNFYFHTSLRCLKRFYEGLKDLEGLHKTF